CSSDLFENRAFLLRHFDNGRTHIVSVFMASIDAFAALYLAAVCSCFLERLLHVVESNLVDQRTDQSAGFKRRTNSDDGICLLETRDEGVVNAFMHEETAQRGAALASGAHCAESDCAQRHVEIGRRADDACIVAAQFENCASKTLGKART